MPAHRRGCLLEWDLPPYMTQPSQYALSKHSVHNGKTSTRQDISVGYIVLPVYAQDTANASQVECVVHFLLSGISSPWLAVIQ